jgi:outer membrane protein assembly factor BamB
MRSSKLRVAVFVFPCLLLAAAPEGAEIYKAHCASCHDAGLPRIPTREALKAFSPEIVNRALVSGAMRFQGSDVSVGERHAVAEFVTAKKFEPDAGAQGMCAATLSAKPGVVFSGALDGHLRAYSTKDGAMLWDYDTVHDFETVTMVKAKGGSLDAAGPAVAGGMLFVNSGYGYFNAIPGNVLLAFSVDSR